MYEMMYEIFFSLTFKPEYFHSQINPGLLVLMHIADFLIY